MVRVKVGLTRAPSQDQRSSPRIALPAFASLEAEQAGEWSPQSFGAVANISRSGLAVRVPHPYSMGEVMEVRIAIKNAIHEMQGRVVRSRKRAPNLFDVALEWTNCSPQVLSHVDAMIRTAAATNLADRLANWNLQPRPREAGTQASV
jgi:hypothetical protein